MLLTAINTDIYACAKTAASRTQGSWTDISMYTHTSTVRKGSEVKASNLHWGQDHLTERFIAH